MKGDAIRRVTEGLRARGLELTRSGRVPCPAHGGSIENLQVKQGRQGVLLKCFSHDCAPDAIATSLGLTMADLFDSGDRQARAPGPDRRLEYPYHDARGYPLFRCVRLEDPQTGKKTRIWQERYDAVTS